MVSSRKTWDELLAFYDLYRTIRLNELYYGNRLKTCRTWSSSAEIGSVFFALSSVPLLLSKDDLGPWPFMVAYVFTVLSVVVCKLIHRRGNEIRYARLHFVYRTIFLEMQEFVARIRLQEDTSTRVSQITEAARRRIRDIGSDEDLSVKRRLRSRLMREVSGEIPTNSLWMPDEWYKKEERSGTNES